MSKRLQVMMEEAELREIHKIARAQQMTVAEWVRQALRKARQRQPVSSIDKKLKVVRSAARHSYPTGDIEQLLAEISRGYLAERDE